MARADREAILARRALLVASALAGIHSQARADTRAPLEPCPVRNPSAEARETARQKFVEAEAALQAGDYALAATLLREAYEASGNVRVLPTLALAEHRAGHPQRALDLLELHERCRGEEPSPPASLTREQVLNESAELRIDGGEPGAQLVLDGAAIDGTPVQMRIAVGEHRLEVRAMGCVPEREYRFELAGGSVHSITLDRECAVPHVCLSPPPPPPESDRARFALGSGMAGLVDLSEPRPSAGGRVELFYGIPFGRALELSLGVVAEPAWGSRGSLMPVGGNLEALLRPASLRFGVGASGGYVFTSISASTGTEYRARPSWFVEPYLVPLGFRLSEDVDAGVRVGLILMRQASATDERFGPAYLDTGIWLRLRFGSAGPDYDEMAVAARTGHGS